MHRPGTERISPRGTPEPPTACPRQRILFFAEPATLAHVARPVVLAGALDPGSYDVAIATGPDFQRIPEEAGLQCLPLWSIGTKRYLAAVAAGRPVFPYPVLKRYVTDDLRLIDNFAPDLIVGDFRLSLAVSARLAKVPYLAITNAYWSPHTAASFEVPVHFLTRLLGARIADRLFQLLRPVIFAQHSLPMHRLRRRHGMPSLGFDLRRVFTEADLALYADVPEMVPTQAPPTGGGHVYIGPVTWAPRVAMPEALLESPDHRPLVYINVGSSGDPALLRQLVDGCASLDCRLAVATGRAGRSIDLGKDAVVAPLLPGHEIAPRAALVICNGGSPGTHQALAAGTPVLGIPANLDQLLNMQFVTRSGAGAAVRADRVSADRVRQVVGRMLAEPSYRNAAARVAGWFAQYPATRRFSAVVADTCAMRQHSDRSDAPIHD